MAVINTLDNGTKGRVEEPFIQLSARAGADLNALTAVRFDTATGRVIPANAANAGNMAGLYGFVIRSVKKGENVTVFRSAVLDGWDLTPLNYGAPVYLGDDGGLSTTAGTVSFKVGMVVPVNVVLPGMAADKLVAIELDGK